MLHLIKPTARVVLEGLNTYHPRYREALAIMQQEQSPPRIVTPARVHLDEAMTWIRHAQDAGGGGVAWGYRARRPVRSGCTMGWIAAHPETTGYIIPTMLRYARLARAEWAAQAARRMADWEVSIQLPDGGFQGGTYGAQPVCSSTFVTGQVLFGLVAAYREWRNSRYRDAALRAGAFLAGCLSAEGRFERGYSLFCKSGPKAYEARTGLALAELGALSGDVSLTEAASRIADYTLSCQQPNGWFRDNDLEWNAKPLTHTIGYVLEGLHGLALLLNRPECLQAVHRTLDTIAKLIREDGFLAGRWSSTWQPMADWVCLTGSAQIAGVFLRLHRETGNPVYREAGRKLLGFVCHTQQIRGESPGLIGGIRGSYPFQGGYGQWCVLNWATKFFADSVMDYLCSQSPTPGE